MDKYLTYEGLLDKKERLSMKSVHYEALIEDLNGQLIAAKAQLEILEDEIKRFAIIEKEFTDKLLTIDPKSITSVSPEEAHLVFFRPQKD